MAPQTRVRRKFAALTARQEKFARCVALKGMTYSDAYRAAYSVENFEDSSVWINASKTRRLAHVSQRIEQLQQVATHRLLMSKQQYLEKLERMALADPRKMFGPQGDVLPIGEISDAEADLIDGIEVIENFTKVGDHPEHTGYTKKLKLASRRQILKDYGEARGWLKQESDEAGPATVFVRRWVKADVYEEAAHAHLSQHPTQPLLVGSGSTSGDPDRVLQPADPGDDSRDGAVASRPGPSGPDARVDAMEAPASPDAGSRPRRAVTRRTITL